MPKQQNIKIFKLIMKFPKIKLIGKKAKTKFVNALELVVIFSEIILNFIKPK